MHRLEPKIAVADEMNCSDAEDDGLSKPVDATPLPWPTVRAPRLSLHGLQQMADSLSKRLDSGPPLPSDELVTPSDVEARCTRLTVLVRAERISLTARVARIRTMWHGDYFGGNSADGFPKSDSIPELDHVDALGVDDHRALREALREMVGVKFDELSKSELQELFAALCVYQHISLNSPTYKLLKARLLDPMVARRAERPCFNGLTWMS